MVTSLILRIPLVHTKKQSTKAYAPVILDLPVAGRKIGIYTYKPMGPKMIHGRPKASYHKPPLQLEFNH